MEDEQGKRKIHYIPGIGRDKGYRRLTPEEIVALRKFMMDSGKINRWLRDQPLDITEDQIPDPDTLPDLDE